MKKDSRLAFLLRVLHSVSGVAFTFFLCEHLFTNFLASSLGGGTSFIAIVNKFHAIPGLKTIEILCLALPFGIHAIIGIAYAINGKFNTFSKDGSSPACNFARNHAYIWQRLTAWVLLLLIGFHVIHMRFFLYPSKVEWKNKSYYAVEALGKNVSVITGKILDYHVLVGDERTAFADELNKELANKKVWILTPTIGEAFYCVVRKAMASFWMATLYSILVLTAVFHGFNGLWTFCARWGIVESARRQELLRMGIYRVIIPIFSLIGMYTIWNLYYAF